MTEPSRFDIPKQVKVFSDRVEIDGVVFPWPIAENSITAKVVGEGGIVFLGLEILADAVTFVPPETKP